MNNNISIFLNKQNIKLLWDILLDELRIDTNNTTLVSNIRTVFESNINPFISKASQTSLLVDLNKLFLSQVVIAVYRLFPKIKQELDLKRINISSEELNQPYKVEDIHTARQSSFEKQVNQKRLEFENSISLKKPKELDFTEKVDDDKIKEMDSLIAETMARRNFEVEQYKPNLISNSEIIDPEKWLRPKETSVNQVNKTNYDEKQKYTNTNTNNEAINNQLKKKVSWNETELTNNDHISNLSLVIDDQNSPSVNFDIKNNIFNKFKKVKDSATSNNTDELTNHSNEFTQQIIDLNQKYNSLNMKVDILIDLVTKITKANNETK
jgi:hypothetical protein